MANITIIEDDLSLARALEEKLHHEGFGVTVMLWGETQLEFLKAAHPDLVLLDLKLPGHSGLEVLAVVRQDTKLTHLPVVILSNFCGEKIQKEVAKLGVFAYLVKTKQRSKRLSQPFAMHWRIRGLCHSAA